jgi:hypothetical protein
LPTRSVSDLLRDRAHADATALRRLAAEDVVALRERFRARGREAVLEA